VKRVLAAIVFLSATLLPGAGSLAAPPPPSVTFGEWHVNGNHFVFNWTTGDFSSPDRVTLTRPGNSISANQLSGNEKKKTALLVGSVVIHDDRGSLTNFTSNGPPMPSTLACDRLSIDGVSKMYVAEGNVHFIQGGREAYADQAIMNGQTHILELKGNVRLTS